ncbi:hypothetical protein B0H16DRAFT_1829544 [Mycena metata]|uniref:Novel STAND NTPase 1 domain-containing protein n=1 Tax=Mycena metata TaxID=1033252 RepID=A0AAD7NXX0_9AGAR|nr:hypothetical protein B0H16DRAFT_1829544 [Mycena metata]
MPHQPTPAQVRLNNVSQSMAIAANTFNALVIMLKISGLEAVSNTVQSLLQLLETVKQDKNECAELMEHTHQLLSAIVGVYIKSDTGAELPPSMLNQIAKFTETLHKIHTYVEAQQSGSKVKRFFRQGELNALLKDSKEGLQQGLDFFQATHNVVQLKTADIIADAMEMQEQAHTRHQEVLDMIEAVSSSDSASSMYSHSYTSSNSISMLPAEPKIFHGRDSELAEILKLFKQGTPRIAILGAGGMGKTSLARTVVHHEEVTTKYHINRFFVTCDTASSKTELAGLIGAHLGSKPGKDPTRAVLQWFSSNSPSLLILDNLETVWEPVESREEIEKFLSLLTDINSLALVITMRGAERPSRVQWIRPFLPPITPLAQDAARKMFIDIADDKHSPEEVDQPIWWMQKAAWRYYLAGRQRKLHSSLKAMTKESIWNYQSHSHSQVPGSPLCPTHRICWPCCLSMLPDGLSDVELKQANFPITDIFGCKAALLRTALAYTDEQRRLKVLVPIREYMARLFPPTDRMIQPMFKHFHELLRSYTVALGTSSGVFPIDRITSNYTNIQNILQNCLQRKHPSIVDVAYCACDFNEFSQHISRGVTSLLEDISNVLSSSEDHRLKAYIITELIRSLPHHLVSHLEALIVEALNHFNYFDDPDLEARFHCSLGDYYFQFNHISTALQHSKIALSLAQANRNFKGQCDALETLGFIETTAGDHVAGRVYAREVQRLAKISGDVYREARGLFNEAISLISLGHYRECITLTRRGRTALSLCGLSHGPINYSLMRIQAEVHKLKSEYVEAHDIQNQIFQETANDNYQQGFTLIDIAEINILMGVSRAEIQKKIEASKVIFKPSNNTVLSIACNIIQADLNLREDDMASTLFCECLQLGLGRYSEAVRFCLERLADINRWEGSHPTSWTAVFLAHSLKAKERLGIYKALQFLGDVFLKENDESTASSLFTLALEGFTQMDVHRSRAECMIRFGDISNTHGDFLRALEFWETARPLFERSSQARRLHDIDKRLAGIGEDVKEQQQRNLIQLTELNAPMGKVEKVEEDLSDNEVGSKETGLVAF